MILSAFLMVGNVAYLAHLERALALAFTYQARFNSGIESGLAQLFCRLSDIEDVFDDLECAADVITKRGERLQLPRGGVRAHAAQPDRAGQQRRGFSFMNVFQLRFGDPFAFPFQIRDLAGDASQLEGLVTAP